MKTLRRCPIIYGFMILFIMACSLSCEKSSSPLEKCSANAKMFEIHLQHMYSDDHVFIKIDGDNIFSGDLTTDNTVSLAAIISPQIDVGNHDLQVFVNAWEADTSFYVQDTLVIGVTYTDSLRLINLKFYEPPNLPIYD